MIYLASPYAHPFPSVMEWRYQRMVDYVNKQFANGVCVYSPIVHNHPAACKGNLPRTWNFWRKIDFDMLRRADALHIIKLNGWKKSIGVKAEWLMAVELNIPVSFIKP